MAGRNMEGQMDFLGLLDEYTDDQGAKVRVREPIEKRIKPVAPPEPEQFKLDFIDLDAEYEAELKAKEEVKVPEMEEIIEPEAIAGPKENIEDEYSPSVEEEPEIEVEIITESTSDEISEPEIEVEIEVKPDSFPIVKEKKPSTRKPKKERSSINSSMVIPDQRLRGPREVVSNDFVIEEKIVKAVKTTDSSPKEILFKQCKRCWCFDCKHNSLNEAVPREMCGAMMACPACDGCKAEDMATICEIGNAKEGCKTRAIEEGILVEENVD